MKLIADPIFEYTPAIDKKIGLAVADILHTEVLDVARIEKGVVNHVYKIETANGPVIARVFSRKGWPEAEKLQWIERELSAHDIPHAKLRYLTREQTHFPYGFMVVEYIDGQDGWEAIKSGAITGEQFFERLGTLLHRIHDVQISQFGQVHNGKGTHQELCAYLQERVKEDIVQLRTISELRPADLDVITHTFDRACSRYMHQMTPVLTHGDPSPHNTRLTSTGTIILVDWDNAEASSFLRDVAALTYDGVHMDQAGDLDRLKAQWEPAFWRGYGAINLPNSAQRNIIAMFHIVQAARLLTFYAFRKLNPEKFTTTRAFLEKLLQEQNV